MKQLKTMFTIGKREALIGAAAGLSVMSSGAFAADDIDVTAIVAKITAGVVAVTAVCTAALSVAVVVKLFKYVRTAM